MLKFLFSLTILLASGVLIGQERQKTHGIIGVRSVTLLMLGAFIFSYISTRIGGDPSRVVAQVVSGVGFIGAGLMIKRDSDKIANITTAILMWCLASLGCLIGFEGEQKVGQNVYAFDPDGGPFLSIGSKIKEKIIKSITSNGVFELE